MYNKAASFSEDRLYRYTLWRVRLGLDALRTPYVAFIGLNPSIADETIDDPTIRRCVGFAESFGYESMCMVNLFAYRATDPKHMMLSKNPVGPNSEFYLRLVLEGAGLIIAAWGNGGAHLDRGNEVRRKFSDLEFNYLKLTKAGQPAHPLYLPKTLKPVLWK